MEFFAIAGKLKDIKRKGWKEKEISLPESVADHSYRLALLGMVLAKKLEVDEGKIIRMALVHDLVESETGDIPTPQKKENFEEEKRIATRIFSKIEDGNEYLGLWEEFELGSSKEAILLAQLDKIEMVMQALEYEKKGIDSKKLDEFWNSAEKEIVDPELKKLFDNLQLKRKN